MPSPRLSCCSCSFSVLSCLRIASMLLRASSVAMLEVKGPLVVNSSIRLATCFLNSSDWANRLLLKRSCGGNSLILEEARHGCSCAVLWSTDLALHRQGSAALRAATAIPRWWGWIFPTREYYMHPTHHPPFPTKDYYTFPQDTPFSPTPHPKRKMFSNYWKNFLLMQRQNF